MERTVRGRPGRLGRTGQRADVRSGPGASAALCPGCTSNRSRRNASGVERCSSAASKARSGGLNAPSSHPAGVPAPRSGDARPRSRSLWPDRSLEEDAGRRMCSSRPATVSPSATPTGAAPGRARPGGEPGPRLIAVAARVRCREPRRLPLRARGPRHTHLRWPVRLACLRRTGGVHRRRHPRGRGCRPRSWQRLGRSPVQGRRIPVRPMRTQELSA